jgi:O-antigen ligase
MADYLAIMSGVSYLMWWRTKDRKYLYLIGWFFLSSILGGVRTGILGIMAVFIVASYLRYRALSLPYMAAVVMFALLSVVFIPQVKEKMFYDPSAVTSIDDLGGIEESQIDSNGRFAMWRWTLNEFYEDNKLTGSGIGSVQERFYSGHHPFGRIKAIHNDYVQILGDIGLIGISLYFLFVLISVWTAMRYMKKRVPLYLQNTAFLVVTSFAAALTTMMTDNVVNYSFAVLSYPFIFVGIMMAYRKIYRRDLKMKKRERTS